MEYNTLMGLRLTVFIHIISLGLLVSCSSQQKENRFVAKNNTETFNILPLIDDVLSDLDTLKNRGHSQAIVCLKINRLKGMAKRMEKRKNWPQIKEARDRVITSFCRGGGFSSTNFGIRALQVKNKIVLIKRRIKRYQRLNI